MIIPILASELRAQGVTTPWPNIPWSVQRQLAAKILLARGDVRTYYMIANGNVIANASMVFFNDLPPQR